MIPSHSEKFAIRIYHIKTNIWKQNDRIYGNKKN